MSKRGLAFLFYFLQNFGCDQIKASADDELNFAKMKVSLFDTELKRLWEKVKMLVTSIFPFSHSVFQSLLFEGRQKLGLCGKELSNWVMR